MFRPTKISLARGAFQNDNCGMITRALLVAAGFLATGFTSFAQQSDSFSDLNNRNVQLPSLALANAEAFAFPDTIASATFTWSNAQSIVDVPLPAVIVKPARRIATVAAGEAKEVQSAPLAGLHKPIFDYAHGEVGVMFGMSASNKFSGEFEAGYLTGTVGNEHLQITAGASYERDNIRRR